MMLPGVTDHDRHEAVTRCRSTETYGIERSLPAAGGSCGIPARCNLGRTAATLGKREQRGRNMEDETTNAIWRAISGGRHRAGDIGRSHLMEATHPCLINCQGL